MGNPGVPWIICLTPLFSVLAFPDVEQLQADVDFKAVTVRWEFADVPRISEFAVVYCEEQRWTNRRCNMKMVPATTGSQAVPGGRKRYQLTIQKLKMATNYTLEVTPLDTDKVKDRSGSRKTRVTTKGFQARATRCLSDASEIEVVTGPYFGGQISVEEVNNTRCILRGDKNSGRTTYILRIDHKVCRSRTDGSVRKNYVVVQENLSILTHSTRRFLVICMYEPRNLTVRADVDLTRVTNELTPVGQTVYEVTDELENAPLMSGGSVIDSRLDAEQGRPLELRHLPAQDHTWMQLVMMVVVVAAAVVASAAAVWYFYTTAKSKRSRAHQFQGPPCPQKEPDVFVYENVNNLIRDFNKEGAAKGPSVALVGIRPLHYESYA